MRDDSSVYSVTNRNTFGPSTVIDIPRLLLLVSFWSEKDSSHFETRFWLVSDDEKLKEDGFEEVKALSVTGGLSFELKEPRVFSICFKRWLYVLLWVGYWGIWQCKPQIQKTGTIYLPFCAEPRQVNYCLFEVKNESCFKNKLQNLSMLRLSYFLSIVRMDIDSRMECRRG